MYAAPTSIFAHLPVQAILTRLSLIKVEAADFGAEIPEVLVLELFAALEAKLPEVGLAVEEIPDSLTPDGIEYVIMEAEAAGDARNEYLLAA